ncbi:MAG: histidine triad nucleotide-binding protein [Gammaproteobacteria bacterium]
MPETIFQKIIDKEIPSDIIFEDDLCIAFKDINPVAPIHILIIPKKPIEKVSDSILEDKELLGHLLLKAGDIARDLGVGDAFRLVVNNGAEAQQTVFHLHIHLIAGREFSWPPG